MRIGDAGEHATDRACLELAPETVRAQQQTPHRRIDQRDLGTVVELDPERAGHDVAQRVAARVSRIEPAGVDQFLHVGVITGDEAERAVLQPIAAGIAGLEDRDLMAVAVAHRRRQRVIFLILVIMLTHAVEIWLFGLAYMFLLQWDMFGSIDGTAQIVNVIDHVYYSAMVYTTVGFGDLVPEGPIRMITSTEALLGLAMITWSASFSYLQMQRIWRD